MVMDYEDYVAARVQNQFEGQGGGSWQEEDPEPAPAPHGSAPAPRSVEPREEPPEVGTVATPGTQLDLIDERALLQTVLSGVITGVVTALVFRYLGFRG